MTGTKGAAGIAPAAPHTRRQANPPKSARKTRRTRSGISGRLLAFHNAELVDPGEAADRLTVGTA